MSVRRYIKGLTPAMIRSYGVEFRAASYSATIAKTADLTWEAWVKTLEMNSATEGEAVLLVDFNANNRVVINTDRTVTATLQCGTSNAVTTTSTTVSSGVFHLITVTYSDDGDKKARVYVDGSECSYSAQTAGVGSAVLPTSFKIGKATADDADLVWMAGDFRWSSIVRTDIEIADAHKYGIPPEDDENVVAHWGKLDPFTTDQTENGNDLTPAGSPVYTEEFYKSAG